MRCIINKLLNKLDAHKIEEGKIRQAMANRKRDNSKTLEGKSNSERQVTWDYNADGK